MDLKLEVPQPHHCYMYYAVSVLPNSLQHLIHLPLAAHAAGSIPPIYDVFTCKSPVAVIMAYPIQSIRLPSLVS